MMTQDNDTLHAEQKKNNETTEKKSMTTVQLKEKLEKFKDSMIAKMTASAAVGMLAGAGVSYAASQINTDQPDQPAEPDQPVEPEGPTVEERLAALEEQEQIRQQQEQERMKHEQERMHQERVRQDNELKRQNPEPKPVGPTKTFFDQHDVKIFESEEMTHDGVTFKVFVGTVDGYPALFAADQNGNIIRMGIDINGDGDFTDEGEVFDLSSEHITANDMQAHVVDIPTPGPTPDPDPDLIKVEHDVDFHGMNVDIATLSDGEHEIQLIDVDKDHEVDLVAADINQNGRIDLEEIADATSEHMPMPSEEDITGTSITSLEDEAQDYTNDADITFYEA